MHACSELRECLWFFYGTLRDQGVRRLVLPPCTQIRFLETARLQGFKLYKVRGEVFPIIVHTGEVSDWVEGDIFDQVDAEDEARLRYFEGEEYVIRKLSYNRRELRLFEARAGEYECEGEWSFTKWMKKEENYKEYLKRIKIYLSHGSW